MKPLEEHTIKEIVAMGYKITLEGPITGKTSSGVIRHIGSSHLTEPIDTDKYIKKPHKGEDK